MSAKSKPIPEELCERIEVVEQRLIAEYGARPFERNDDPMEELVSTILSQHTTDTASWKAYQALRHRFPTWEEMRAASIEEIAEPIRPAGLAMQKARTIQSALDVVDDETLAALEFLPVAEARAKLTTIRGVGDKTASIVLLFSLGLPAQPVDTHIERVTKRLGINNGESTATGIQHVYEHCLPGNGPSMYAFHVAMIRHGREICQARSPKCEICVLNDICDYYANIKEMDADESG